jgi:hypothetical protein
MFRWKAFPFHGGEEMLILLIVLFQMAGGIT